MSRLTLTQAIDELIHSLCLDCYPCGRGSWRRPRLRKCQDQDEDECGEASLEEEDALLELLRSPLSPWQEEYPWSPQALPLKELAVKRPEILKGNFIYSFLTTLRIVGKEVSVIDEGLLMFTCLEELVLSANHITELLPENLPKTLQVLELYANHISSLKSLSANPPPPHLQHLGLGNNCLGQPEDIQCFAVDLWPQLISLDLGWCGFTDLYSLVEALSNLPRLRCLVLEGNPLTLTPSYPGFVLDSLFRLLYLDGTQITSDDQHRFRGLAQCKVCEEAEVTVCVLKMSGVPSPALPSDEFPIISHSYSVSYEFLDQPELKDIQSDVKVQTSADVHQTLQDQHGEAAPISCPPADHLQSRSQNQDHIVPVLMNNTLKQEWAETIELNYRKTHHSRDLRALKNFLLRGLWLSVEEEKVQSWPAPPEKSAGTKASADKKGKEITDVGQKLKDKKKKKESMLNLVQETPVKHTLASVHVDLKELLEGKDQIQIKCDMGVLFSDKRARTASRDKEQSKRPKEVKKEEKKQIPGGDMSAQRTGTSSRGKGKRRMKNEADAPADDTISPCLEPLIVEFSVQLGKMTSASQCTNPHCSTTTNFSLE